MVLSCGNYQYSKLPFTTTRRRRCVVTASNMYIYVHSMLFTYVTENEKGCFIYINVYREVKYIFIYESLRAILCALVVRLHCNFVGGGGQMKKLIVMGAREGRFNVPQAE